MRSVFGEDPTSIYHAQMTQSARRIRFKAKLLRPASAAKGSSWTFLTLPKTASAKLPSRGMTTVEGTINGFPVRATLEPDGQKGHWLKVSRKLREAAGTDVSAVVTMEIALAGEEPEPVPADLRQRPRPRQLGRPARSSASVVGCSNGFACVRDYRLTPSGSGARHRCSCSLPRKRAEGTLYAANTATGAGTRCMARRA